VAAAGVLGGVAWARYVEPEENFGKADFYEGGIRGLFGTLGTRWRTFLDKLNGFGRKSRAKIRILVPRVVDIIVGPIEVVSVDPVAIGSVFRKLNLRGSYSLPLLCQFSLEPCITNAANHETDIFTT